MVKPAPGKLVLIADAARKAWVERSGHAPDLVVHSNDDVPPPAVPLVPHVDTRPDAPPRRDLHARYGVAISVLAHVALLGAMFWFAPGAAEPPPMMIMEMVFADVQSDEVTKDEGAPAAVQPPPPPTPVVEEPPPPEPEPPPQVAEVPPEPPPPEPEPPVAEVPPEPPPPPEPDALPEIVKEPEPPPPPPPEIKVEKPPEPKVKPKPRPPKPPVKLVEPPPQQPTQTVVAPQDDKIPPKTEVGQAMEAQQAAAPEIRQDKVPQDATPQATAGPPVVNTVKFRSKRTPDYPTRAKELSIEGTVVLELTIGTDGNPTEVVIVESSGSPLLDDAAKRGAWRWTFWPTTIDGRPTEARGRVAVPFFFTKR